MIVHLYFNKIISMTDQRGRCTLDVKRTFTDPHGSEEIVTEKKKNMPSAVTTRAADGGAVTRAEQTGHNRRVMGGRRSLGGLPQWLAFFCAEPEAV